LQVTHNPAITLASLLLMPTKTRTVEAIAVNLKTGYLRNGLSRQGIIRELNIPDSTLTRYITLLVCHVPEFDYQPYNNRWFTHFQIHAIRTIRDWFNQSMTNNDIIKILQTEGLPDD
jgi:hypothetical protein